MKLLTVIPELQPFLERLRPAFSRRQFRHLARYVIGLVASRRKTIRSIARSTIDRFDQSSLNRFMNSGAWETEALSEACKTMALEDHKDCPGGEILLIIDDTLLEKSGETMESVGYQYSAKDGESILAHDLVSCVMVCSCRQVVPVDLRHYVKAKVCEEEKREFKTRIELAREMIESFTIPAGRGGASKRTVVLFDSWYLCKEIVDAIKRRGWHFVSESKSNRNVRTADGAPFVNASAVGLSEADGSTMPFRARTYLHRELDVFMPSLGINGDVRLMVEREMDGKDENHYVVTDMTGISAEELLSLFKARHITEEFYRDAKQNLGLDSYMVRGHEATNRHWWAIFLAYMSLNQLKRTVLGLEDMTVGQLCEWVEERCEQIKWNAVILPSLPAT
jgi:DDE superfamily endonuclease